MKRILLTTSLNFLAILLLITLIAAPIYFAQNINKIAGVKTESSYLLISQTEKFPGMTFSQSDNAYTVGFTKQAQKQAYLSVLIINNPTAQTKSYIIQNRSTTSEAFFGENINDPQRSVTLPAQSSLPISIIARNALQQEEISFKIQTE